MFYTSYKSAPNFYRVFKPVFDEIVNEVNKMESALPSLPANMYEFDTYYQVDVKAPTFSKDNVKIQIADNKLTITGTLVKEENNAKVLLHEFNSTDFSKTVTLPKNADANQVQAKFEHGILTIMIQKIAVQPAKTIEII